MNTLLTKQCRNCNKDFQVWQATIESGKRKGKEWGVFCGRSCRNSGKFHHKYNGGIDKTVRTCKNCAKDFIITIQMTRDRPAIFCTILCANKYNRQPTKGFTISTNGYRQLYMPNHINAIGCYFPEHRYVMEQSIGRYLATGEIVHHKNRDKLDNRLENLVIMTPSEHAIEHIPDRNNAVDWTPKRRKAFGEQVKAYRKEHFWSSKKVVT